MMARFHLQGIDCNNCAEEIKRALKKNPKTQNAKVYFPACELECDKECLDEVLKILKSHKVTLSNKQEEFSHTKMIVIFVLYLLGLVGIVYKPCLIFLLFSYLIAIKDIFLQALNSFRNKNFFNENTLMLSASIAAFFLDAYIEAVSIIVLYTLGEHLQAFALYRSKLALNNLLFSMPNEIEILVDGEWVKRDINEVRVGDRALLRAGDRVGLDLCIKKGSAYVDLSAISGESIPLALEVGDMIKSGGVVLDGAIEAEVVHQKDDSHFYQMQRLIQKSLEQKSKLEGFISQFARIYTPIVFVLALGIAILVPIFVGDFREWIYRGLVVLMVSCPCALMLCIPLGYCASIGALSKKGILLKQSQILDEMIKIDCVVFDKTGTLSEGKLFFKEAVLKTGKQEQLISCIKSALFNSKHIIAQAACSLDGEIWPVSMANEIAGKGVIATSTQGRLVVGNARLLKDEGMIIEEYKGSSLVVYAAKDGEYLGYVLFEDRLRNEAKPIVDALKSMGKKIYIFSGDREESVSKIANILGCEYRANMLPGEKYEGILELQKTYRVLFVGDGINDAGAISSANIGVSMGGQGSDLAQMSADVVLLGGLGALDKLFLTAKKMRKITWQNLSFIFIVKLVFIILGIFGVADIWEAIFGDVGVSLLAILNAVRLFL